MQLNDLRTLGRSGLPVSPLALGTMTFGNKQWGSTDEVAREVFDKYIDTGGNFIDTADVYSGGKSEDLIGKFVADRSLRDEIVLATKFSFSGGNGRKNLARALEGSLRRLGTEYVDLYWVHVWDSVTPAEELLQSMNDLVRSGKIRYFGLSDVPAWYATRLSTLAQTYQLAGPIALQLAYSLVERTIEHEHIPAARELGIGITPWSPLAAGFLTGKYRREGDGKAFQAGGRLDSDNQPFRMFTERNWKILDALRAVSEKASLPPAQIALSWALSQPGVTSLILGATTVTQLESNLASLDVHLDRSDGESLSESSGDTNQFYTLFSDQVRKRIFRGNKVEAWLEQPH